MSSRQPAVAGLFYPAQPERLAAEVDAYIETAKIPELPDVKALVAPHAGYIYSGGVAGAAYSTLRFRQHTVKRVILIGPAHRLAFRGLAHSGDDAFVTPLGEVQIDRETIEQLEQQCKVLRLPEAHRQEHSLEVQLPFLLRSIQQPFILLPLVAGDVTGDRVAQLLQLVWCPEDLILVSSDLSHYLSYEEATHKDKATSQKIIQLQGELNGYQACGCRALNGLIEFAKRQQWQAKCLDLRNSGDTAGDKSRVVGYGAYAFY
jgi:hypothetical protein